MAEKNRYRESSCVEDEYPDDVEYRDSQEEIFYPTSNEVSRVDIDRPRRNREGSAESEFYRNHYAATRDALLRVQQDDYIQELHQALDRQEQEIKELDSNLKDLREECREYFTNLEEKLTSFEEKVDLVINLVSSWVNHSSGDRRCRGMCTKHVRTEKCFCRGLREPHRCCGRIGGICDC